ncbi:hypothetical protein [Paraburkholderia sp. J76]|uniref:hypothetical protein n=1 Tax=Paraburkholderia sp. J76 TaxID=2805439 RepID=UPI002ABDA205|nr:hypothetical protein [Paraburkholderia sp. J76]
MKFEQFQQRLEPERTTVELRNVVGDSLDCSRGRNFVQTGQDLVYLTVVVGARPLGLAGFVDPLTVDAVAVNPVR